MKRYRIVTNGKKFRIQSRGWCVFWFAWTDCGRSRLLGFPKDNWPPNYPDEEYGESEFHVNYFVSEFKPLEFNLVGEAKLLLFKMILDEKERKKHKKFRPVA